MWICNIHSSKLLWYYNLATNHITEIVQGQKHYSLYDYLILSSGGWNINFLILTWHALNFLLVYSAGLIVVISSISFIFTIFLNFIINTSIQTPKCKSSNFDFTCLIWQTLTDKIRMHKWKKKISTKQFMMQ